jgi:hypothetical protein
MFHASGKSIVNILAYTMGSKGLFAPLPLGVIVNDNQMCFISRCARNSLRLSVRPSERLEQLERRQTAIKEISHWRFY